MLDHLRVSHRREGAVVVFALEGEVDVYTAPKLREATWPVIEREAPRHVVLELSELDYLDSTGIGVLVKAFMMHQEQEQPGVFVWAAPQARTAKLLVITGLIKLFPRADSVEDALALAAEQDRKIHSNP